MLHCFYAMMLPETPFTIHLRGNLESSRTTSVSGRFEHWSTRVKGHHEAITAKQRCKLSKYSLCIDVWAILTVIERLNYVPIIVTEYFLHWIGSKSLFSRFGSFFLAVTIILHGPWAITIPSSHLCGKFSKLSPTFGKFISEIEIKFFKKIKSFAKLKFHGVLCQFMSSYVNFIERKILAWYVWISCLKVSCQRHKMSSKVSTGKSQPPISRNSDFLW